MGLTERSFEDEAAGLPARRFAFSLVTRVLDGRVTLDEANTALAQVASRMPGRDAAFGRAIAYAALRHKGSLEALLARFLDHPLPTHGLAASRVLLCGAAELIVLDGASHAAVDGANRLAVAVREAKPFKPLVNAVLRRVVREGKALYAQLDAPTLDTPDWLRTRWEDAFGTATAHAIASVHGRPAPLDLTVPPTEGPDRWAETLQAVRIGPQSLRLPGHPQVEALPGYEDGIWWVQDAAASLPAQILLDHIRRPEGAALIDLCAAPGGKTLQLASAGADVTAVDSSAARLKRLSANLERTGQTARIICADARAWRPEASVAGVLLDAPCSATGTIRRHPELPWIRDMGAITRNAALSADLLDAAWAMVAPGGTLVFAVCSLEREEGEDQVAAFARRHEDVRILAIDPTRYGLPAEAAGRAGGLRILPSMLADQGGMDGFFVAVLQRPGPVAAPFSGG